MMGMLRRSPNSASGRVRVKPRSANGKRSLARDDRGQSIVEFALVSTFLVLPLVVGIVVFGIAFNRQIILTNAVNNAAMQAGLSRQSSPLTCAMSSTRQLPAPPPPSTHLPIRSRSRFWWRVAPLTAPPPGNRFRRTSR